jgi:hypothetical protein
MNVKEKKQDEYETKLCLTNLDVVEDHFRAEFHTFDVTNLEKKERKRSKGGQESNNV